MKTLLYWVLTGLSLSGVASSCVVSYQVGFAHGLERAQHSSDLVPAAASPMPNLDQLRVVEQDLNPPSGGAIECP